MSSNGWCSISLAEGDISGTLVQYLLVNFGAEVVVEAIGTAPANNGNYLQRYIVEYARSDGQFFNVSGENGIVSSLSPIVYGLLCMCICILGMTMNIS